MSLLERAVAPRMEEMRQQSAAAAASAFAATPAPGTLKLNTIQTARSIRLGVREHAARAGEALRPLDEAEAGAEPAGAELAEGDSVRAWCSASGVGFAAGGRLLLPKRSRPMTMMTTISTSSTLLC